MKCELCKQDNAILWFNLMAVCLDCFNKLEQRKEQKKSNNLRVKEDPLKPADYSKNGN